MVLVVLLHALWDKSLGIRPSFTSFHVRFAPKATELLRRRECREGSLADTSTATAHVRYSPKSGLMHCSNSLDQFVGSCEQ
jgi:hypothetical protein